MVELGFRTSRYARRVGSISQAIIQPSIELPRHDPTTLNYVHCPDAAGGQRRLSGSGARPAARTSWCVCTACRARGADFDVLAQALPEQARGTACVWSALMWWAAAKATGLKDPMGYQLRTYAGDMLAMLGQLHAQAPVTSLDWVGTSMGGLIGAVVCGTPGLPLPAPVRRLVLNDVGPAIQWQAIVRIGTYLGLAGHFGSVQGAADAMWAISQSFGPHTPEQWLSLSRPILRRVSEARRHKSAAALRPGHRRAVQAGDRGVRAPG